MKHLKGKYLLFLVIWTLSFQFTLAQSLNPANWSFEVSKNKVGIGAEVDVIFNITLDTSWYIYTNDFKLDLGPTPTQIKFEPNKSYELVGQTVPINAVEKYDEVLDVTYKYMDRNAGFKQRVKILTENPIIKGNYSFLVCSMVNGKCIPGKGSFEITSIKVKRNSEEPQY